MRFLDKRRVFFGKIEKFFVFFLYFIINFLKNQISLSSLQRGSISEVAERKLRESKSRGGESWGSVKDGIGSGEIKREIARREELNFGIFPVAYEGQTCEQKIAIWGYGVGFGSLCRSRPAATRQAEKAGHRPPLLL